MKENKSQNTPIREGIFHVLFWLLVIHFLFDIDGLFYSFKGLLSTSGNELFDDAFLLLPISIGLFYWNHTYLIPKILNQGRWIKYCIGLLLSYIFAWYLTILIYRFLVINNFVFEIYF